MCLPLGPRLIFQIQFEVDVLIGTHLSCKHRPMLPPRPPRRSTWCTAQPGPLSSVPACACECVYVCPRSCSALLCVYLMFSNGLLSEKPPLLYDNLSTRFYSCPTLGFCCFAASVCPLLTKTTVLLFFSTFNIESPLSSLDSAANESGHERKRGLCSRAACNNLPMKKNPAYKLTLFINPQTPHAQLC